MVTEEEVLAALRKVVDPDLGKDVVSLGWVKDLKLDGGAVSFTLKLTTPACPFQQDLVARSREAVKSLAGVSRVEINVVYDVARTTPADNVATYKIRNIIAVGSGKGGVGKSTVAVNLAVALAMSGAKVGVLDADIYGASVPLMIGANTPPEVAGENLLKPSEVAGIKVMSVGLLVPPGTPVIWRGALVTKAIQEFVTNVDWGELDYLIVDLPPGTGDAPLTVAQNLKPTGAIIVTTPQRASIEVALKTLTMFRKLDVPVLGIIENMSYLVCPYCGREIDLFGKGSVETVAKHLQVPFLGSVPIDPRLREAEDNGELIVDFQDSPAAKALIEIARRVAAKVSVLAYSKKSKGGEEGEGGISAFLPMPPRG
ncbi:MAG: Mrp/NBP35 family ATP-binding protein [Conexivisphaera sp.]